MNTESNEEKCECEAIMDGKILDTAFCSIHVSSPTWQEQEREAFMKWSIYWETKSQDEVMEYFLTRLELARKDEQDKCKNILNSGRKMFEMGRSQALDEAISTVRECKGYFEMCEVRDYADTILSALQALKDKPL